MGVGVGEADGEASNRAGATHAIAIRWVSAAIVARLRLACWLTGGVRERRGRHAGYRLVYALRRQAGPGRMVEAELKAERSRPLRQTSKDVGFQYRLQKIQR